MTSKHVKSKASKATQNLSNVKEESSHSNTSSSEGVTTVILDAVSRYWKFLLVALPLLFALTLYKQSSAVIHNLINAPDEALKEAIFGEKPHLFYCDRELPAEARKKDNALEGLPGFFTQLNSLKGQEMGFAVLNCSQTLPSGKTIFERFQLKREVKPVIFGSAPWLFRPKQLLPSHMKNIDAMRKHVEETFLTPKSIGIKSDKDFHNVCAFAKNVVHDDRNISHTCFVLVKGEKYAQNSNSKLLNEFEGRLVQLYPKARFVAVNGKQLRLSFEDVEATPHDDFALRVHAVRNGSHFLSMDKPPTWDYLDDFVSQAVSSPLYSFAKHAEKDAVRLIKPAQLAKKATKKKLMEEKQKKKQEKMEEDQKKKKEQQREAARQRRAAAAAAKKENKEQEKKNEDKDDDVDELDLDVEEKAERVTTEQTIDGQTAKESEQREKERDLEAERQERLLQEQRRREEMERQAREQVFEARDDADEDVDADEEHDEEHIIEL